MRIGRYTPLDESGVIFSPVPLAENERLDCQSVNAPSVKKEQPKQTFSLTTSKKFYFLVDKHPWFVLELSLSSGHGVIAQLVRVSR